MASPLNVEARLADLVAESEARDDPIFVGAVGRLLGALEHAKQSGWTPSASARSLVLTHEAQADAIRIPWEMPPAVAARQIRELLRASEASQQRRPAPSEPRQTPGRVGRPVTSVRTSAPWHEYAYGGDHISYRSG